jgi:hypothetical protein
MIQFEKKATKGLVSVIIPTYRKERFIGDTLATIGHQSYKNWEVIVVEDGSENGSEPIVRQFAKKHRWHRVAYYRNERNLGAAQTRNIAFTKARGEYIALLDSDDRWLPEHLARSVHGLEKSGKDIVYSTVLMVEDQTEMPLGTWGPLHHELAEFPHSLFARSYITPSATVMRRQVIADVGEWDTSLKYCEDYCFWLQCIAAGKTFQHIGGCYCLYRKNHAGATTQRLCGTLEEVARVTERFINTPGLREKTIRRFASEAYLLVARMHLTANPSVDPSADPSRTGPLLLEAWRLRKKRVGHLAEGSWRILMDKIRGRHKPIAAAAPAKRAMEQPRRAAA